MRTLSITAAAAAVLITGCSSSSASKTEPQPAPAIPSSQPAATPSPSTAPGLGQTQTVVTGEYTARVTAYAFRQPLASRFPPDRKGYTYAGIDIRTCLTKGPTSVGVSWNTWQLTYKDDTAIDPVSSWSDDWFQVTLYPGFERSLRVGRCVRGWALYEVPKAKRPTGITYEPTGEDGTPMDGAEWVIR